MGTLVYDLSEPGPRPCVFVSKGHHALKLSRFCSRDLAVASVRLRLGGGLTDLIVCSAYFSYDSAEHSPTEKLRAVMEHCRREGLDLVIGCDANSHHVAWGSSNTNKRGTALLEYLSSSNLEILIRGSRPTFVTSRRQEVIDLTQGTSRVARLLEEWRVDDKDSLSDHRRILFKLRTEMAQPVVRTYRDPRATDWALYKRDLKGRLGEIRLRVKFCSEVEALPLVAKLRRVLANGPQPSLGGLSLPNGEQLEKHKDILAHLLEVHFPGSDQVEHNPLIQGELRATRPGDWTTAAAVVTYGRIRWALDSFDGYKSPGTDGLFPALLQNGGDGLVKHLICVFRACLALRYVPKPWREVKIVFILKTGKDKYDQAKAFRPISLTSFLLKTLERLVDRFIRDAALARMPVQSSQHVYQAGKSVETALHGLVCEIEGALDRKESMLCVFLDVEGAFDNTSFKAICGAANDFHIDDILVQ
ncbi:PREDICTED: uncharacterized protein LOC107073922 [Polistes dominula]|uniref:Uncharacterized protein LOC107073922 n=1 Tax=Polistes dominula TaxID=743375 RepID=A0ABM1JD58_POLDO|nr:PREDICTED: uncharacterized protein LOC107073922 [Polistes dominula]